MAGTSPCHPLQSAGGSFFSHSLSVCYCACACGMSPKGLCMAVASISLSLSVTLAAYQPIFLLSSLLTPCSVFPLEPEPKAALFCLLL